MGHAQMNLKLGSLAGFYSIEISQCIVIFFSFSGDCYDAHVILLVYLCITYCLNSKMIVIYKQ